MTDRSIPGDPGSVLIIDDDEDILTAGKLLLKRRFGRVTTSSDPARIPTLMADHDYDAILLDMNFGPGESSGKAGFHWLGEILRIDPEAVVVLITAHGGVDVAVNAMKLGATDFVMKPWQNEKLLATLSTAVTLKQTRNRARELAHSNAALAAAVNALGQPDAGQLMLGNSPAMHRLKELIVQAAPTDANLLILGENGTGKELVARAVHQQSRRHDQVFVSIDLGAVAENLFESELFGHVKGAFTDAREDRVGRFEAANGGTLFLDEIGNLPLHLQAKLLTALEQRTITPVGSNREIKVDVRIIAATNRPLAELQDDARFRQDLLFRLNTVALQLPPLRERKEDIAEIAHHYLQVFSRKYDKPDKHFSAAALAAIEAYHWPGNVRALKHAMERAVILSQTPEYSPTDFIPDNNTIEAPATPIGASENDDEAEELNLERLEKHAISQALRRHGYNISHAARALGLTRAALYRRMEKHGL